MENTARLKIELKGDSALLAEGFVDGVRCVLELLGEAEKDAVAMGNPIAQDLSNISSHILRIIPGCVQIYVEHITAEKNSKGGISNEQDRIDC